jgi:hypothetical protein
MAREDGMRNLTPRDVQTVRFEIIVDHVMHSCTARSYILQLPDPIASGN